MDLPWQRAENLKKKSSKIPKNNYAATMVSAARPQIFGGGDAARPAHGSITAYLLGYVDCATDLKIFI